MTATCVTAVKLRSNETVAVVAGSPESRAFTELVQDMEAMQADIAENDAVIDSLREQLDYARQQLASVVYAAEGTVMVLATTKELAENGQLVLTEATTSLTGSTVYTCSRRKK
jgi:hypothetical protein